MVKAAWQPKSTMAVEERWRSVCAHTKYHPALGAQELRAPADDAAVGCEVSQPGGPSAPCHGGLPPRPTRLVAVRALQGKRTGVRLPASQAIGPVRSRSLTLILRFIVLVTP